jgi:hypothetical protein
MCTSKQSRVVSDLGISYNNNLSFKPHVESVCKTANSLCAVIFRSFQSRDPMLLIFLFNIYVHQHLEYASLMWSPHMKCNVACLEKIQSSFTERTSCLRHLHYSECLAALHTKSLIHRWLFLDLVFLYKIVHGIVMK